MTNRQASYIAGTIGDVGDEDNFVINNKHCILLRNINCWTCILVYLLCIFLTIVSILYAFGQITTLQVADFFCPQYTQEQVLQHSIDYGLNEGDPNSCWSTKSFRVNFEYMYYFTNTK